MTIKHRSQLIELMKFHKLPLIAAELGVAEGLHSRDMLVQGMYRLYMVDNWGKIDGTTGDANSPHEWHEKNRLNAMELVAPFGERAIPLRGMTAEMAANVPDESLGMLYLDAGHDYKNVMSDLVAWFPKVVPGGIIAGHDYLMPQYGVFDAVRDFTAGKYEVHTIHENEVKDAGFWFMKP